MVKKRLIFTLLVENGQFMLSRNFRLQKVGDLNWIRENYEFDSIAQSIDELIVLNVDRNVKNMQCFGHILEELVKNCFMPIAAGGGIRSVDDAFKLFDAGADKIVINSPIIIDPKLVVKLVSIFGSQSIIASIDYLTKDNQDYVYIENGQVNTNLLVGKVVKDVEKLKMGEIYLTSINRDGTGQGYDIDKIKFLSTLSSLPFIASGGVGKFSHLSEGIHMSHVQAVSTANLFNFIADGLAEARKYLLSDGIDLAEWDVDFFDH